MKKKDIVWILCFIGFVVGFILLGNFNTPYKVCTMWLNEPYNAGAYEYALQHLPGIKIGYFGGLTLMIISPVILFLYTIKEKEKEKSTTIQDNLEDLVD